MYMPLPAQPGLPPVRIDLYSDTHTRPTAAMRAAMMEAEVGDEQYGDDPTVNALCERMAALLGKEAAVFLPSGTMCNQIAVLTHTRPGDEVLCHETAHLVTSEGGGASALSGVNLLGLRGAEGQFDAAAVTEALRPRTRNAPPQSLLSVEQTTNIAGGAVWPVTALDAVAATAHAAGLATHMDGARLFNAVVASNLPVGAHVRGFDTVWVDFTKGLGAPLGAVLAGTGAFIGAAWRWKQRLGGAMRQAGMCAAACLYALDHNIARLAEDHANAARLAAGLARVPGLAVQAPATNLVFFEITDGRFPIEELAMRARRAGLLVSLLGRNRARACTHLDVTEADVDDAVAILSDAMKAG